MLTDDPAIFMFRHPLFRTPAIATTVDPVLYWTIYG
jgi:hypothetical protein